MKKILFALTAVLLLVSCSSKADYSAINTKIEKGQSLTKSDYSAIVDYLVDVNKEAAKINDFQEMAKLVEKYPYMQSFTVALQSADESMISSSDKKKLEKMQGDVEKQWENLEDVDFPEFEVE